MREYHILNLGAGVQSTCLYLMACERESGIPYFDAAIFADTGEEPQEVYSHLQHLQTLGGPTILIRSKGSRLGDDLMKGQNSSGGRFISIPAFTEESYLTRGDRKVKEGRVRRQCTKEYKVEVVERAIRRDVIGLLPRMRIPKGVHVYQYFGITTDEAGRAARGKKRFEKIQWSTPVYPFIDMGWSRTDCLKYLEGRFPYSVPRSACVFCPYKTNAEWHRLKTTDPDGWARAVEIDRALRNPDCVVNRNMDKSFYLHRTCIPLELVEFQRQPIETLHPMALNECVGMCGV